MFTVPVIFRVSRSHYWGYLLTQQVHRVSSVGAGSSPFKRGLFTLNLFSFSTYIISKLAQLVKSFLRLFALFLHCVNSVIGKGIEPHPTNGHTQNNLSNDIETHGASTISTPCLPCGSSRFASPLSTQHNYYTKTRLECQVIFDIILI